MRRKGIYVIQIALSLVLASGMAISCAVPSAESPSQPPEQQPPLPEQQPPPVSTYPADISGQVIIAQKVIAKYQSESFAGETMEMNPLEGQIYWIVDISVKNKSYESEVMANHTHWKIVADDNIYDAQRPFMSIQPAYPMTVPMGETGETTIQFPVPDTLQISEAKICYQGQEPYSYGEISGGDRVAVYDWDLRTVAAVTWEEGGKYGGYFVKKEIVGYEEREIGGIVFEDPIYEDIYMELETVGRSKKGTSGDAVPSFNLSGGIWGYHWFIELNISVAPWVVNWSYEPREFTVLDPEGSEATFDAKIFSKANFDRYFHTGDRGLLFLLWDEGEYRGVSNNDVHCRVIHEPGDYVIVLTTKNPEDIVDWWLKIGVE